MHVAIVTETYPPEVNGVALTVHALERGLRELGHRVSLVRPRQAGVHAGHDDALLVRGAPLPRYPGLRFGLPAGAALRSRWSADRPHAVYVATEGPLGWSAVRAATMLGIGAATGFHTRFDDYMARYGVGFLTPLAFAWLRRFHNRAHATLVPTEELAAYLRSRGFERVARLGRGVDTALFHPARRSAALRAQWGVQQDQLAVVHVGRLAAEKNLELLFDAFDAIRDVRCEARLVVVGDGPARAALERAHPDAVFVGTQRGEALAAHYASGDLFLFPSLSETFGNVTLEAMASGVPTVAFDYGAAREYLRDGEHGAAVPRTDRDAFVAAGRRLAADEPLRMRMAAAARIAVESLSPQRVAAEFAELLSALARRETSQ